MFLPPPTQPHIKPLKRQLTPRFYDGSSPSNLRASLAATSIYCLGHSLMSHQNSRMLAAMTASEGNTLANYNFSYIIGSPLTNHALNYRSIDPPGSTFTRNNGDVTDRWDFQLGLGYDAFVMTEAVDEDQGIAVHIQYSDTVATAETLYDAAIAGNPTCSVWMMETAMYQNYPTMDEWYTGVRGEHLTAWKTIRPLINPNVRDVKMLWVGQAFADLYQAVQAGAITGITDFTEFFADYVHPNDIGFYFNACVIYSYIYQKSPLGLAYSGIGNGNFGIYNSPDATLAAELQSLAWNSYQTHRDIS